MLSLDDDELQILMRAAATVAPAQRDGFLRALANELRARNANDKSSFAHVVADLQRRWVGWVFANPCLPHEAADVANVG